jgi:hypothetical protein
MATERNTTRRAVLAGATALAAGTAVNAAAIATTKAASDDAELLALGPELEQLAAEWVAQYAISNKDLADFNAEVYAATGITRADQPRYSEESSYWKALLAISAERSRIRPADALTRTAAVLSGTAFTIV